MPDLLHSTDLWVGVGVVSVVLFFGTLLAVPKLVARLPADYFVGPRPPPPQPTRHPALAFVGRLLRNVLGVVFVAAGIAMLVLPGQGILTIALGVALVDFPGKRSLEQRLVQQRHVRKSLTWMRERAGKEPLRFEEREP
jgi:hypothetical protein